jgi:thioredoxin reductase (NADPH)
MSDSADLDCLVIGGGPAGLTAAIYLARFHLRVAVADAGASRAGLIPLTRNHAGFPEGIAGTDLLARMRDQAQRYGATLARTSIAQLERAGDDFVAQGGANLFKSRTVLLATGVSNHRPAIDEAMHAQALERGLLRYCPICDGFEVTDRRICVLGTGERGVKEAIFLRSYSRDLSLIAPAGAHDLTNEQRTALRDAGIAVVDGPCASFALGEDTIEVETPAGTQAFASLYPALGSTIHSDLAVDLGAKASGDGCLVVDSHQRTSVPGLYAAGDVVLGLDQISHAMGEGGVAATTIRNDLAERSPLRR